MGLLHRTLAVALTVPWIFSLSALTASEPAFGQKRLALVIGINNYPKLKTQKNPANGQLLKAVADAETMGATLKGIGFDVELAVNVDRTDFLTALDRVKRKAAPGDTFFFYFAGHGVAFRGSNLLLPSDVPPVDPDAEQLIRGLSIAETDIIETMREKGVALTILTLDACRNNPIEEFAQEQARVQGRAFRSVGTMRSVGLETRPTSGVFSIYSAGIGQEALDRLRTDGATDRNSVFTRVFSRKLRESGRHLADIMEDVKEEVAKLAATETHPDTRLPHKQFPAYYNETQGGRVFLAGLPKVVPATEAERLAAAAEERRRAAEDEARRLSAEIEKQRQAVAEAERRRRAMEDDIERRRQAALDQEAEQRRRAADTPRAVDPPPQRDSKDSETRRLALQTPVQPNDRFGAIALSPSTLAWGRSTNYRSLLEAEDRAMVECKKRANDCQALRWVRNACHAVALGSNTWGHAWNTNLATARNMALAECRKRGQTCTVAHADCSRVN